MPTTSECLAKGERHLADRQVPEPRANAEWLMAEVLKSGRAELALQASRALTAKQENQFWNLILQRAKRVPLAYVLGHQPFMGLDIHVTENVLIPRPETEELVAEAERLLAPRAGEPLHFLEIGTGSGCIAVALAARFPKVYIYATDISSSALDLALKNALEHGQAARIRFVREDSLKGGFSFASQTGWAHLVISNPPYIPTARLKTLEREVLREPVLALDGGKDGLDAIRAIVAAAPGLLAPGGYLALEIDCEQGAAVAKLMHQAGLSGVMIRKDLQGLDRIAVGRKAAAEVIPSAKP